MLVACASLPDAGRPLPGGFELSGRVAIRYGKDAASGKIFWRHSGDSDELLITSPIGQGIARISRERDRFRLVTGDNKEYRAADAENLTEQALGWRLPLDGLSDWVQARPSPGRPAEIRGEQDNGLQIRQDGWQVAYEEFRGGKPFRMRLKREDIEIVLVVDQWTN
ncbi:MAG TPA: lipoprotein insertase outer membrane protein LolB [Burkholderiales bacterium]|nr:lipoprotein insertase outer membrane protein LolB [Burkholderiales bacterium]